MELPSDSKSVPLSEEDLHAMVDGAVSQEHLRVLELRVAGDPEAAATLHSWRLQREGLQALHADMLDAPVPPGLLAAAQRAQGAGQRRDRWWRWGGMAASVLLSFGLGWGLHGSVQTGDPAARVRPTLASRDASEFVRQAAVAHAVYTPEVRHPVEVGAAQQEHLVQWLSKRLESPLKVPDLASLGYELVGGRLLPGASGARAQFMYQRGDGVRITLYLGALRDVPPGSLTGPHPPVGNESAFSYSSDGPVPSFYWVEQGFGYALAGQLPREQLMRIAEAVYRQL